MQYIKLRKETQKLLCEETWGTQCGQNINTVYTNNFTDFSLFSKF